MITADVQAKMSPKEALNRLVEGNERFTKNYREQHNYREEVASAATGQWPFAVVLSCIDSRTSPSIIFDQSIGDFFNTRVAGNVVNDDVLASMEYAVKYAGAKLVVVLGHTSCGAVTSACKGVKDGHITALLDKIRPSIEHCGCGRGSALDVDRVAADHVESSLEEVRKRSDILAKMEGNGDIMIVGAMYDIASGVVTFMNAN